MDSKEQHLPSLSWTPAIAQLIDLALLEDLGRGDVTTESVGASEDAIGTIICREPVVVCGLSLIGWIIDRSQEKLCYEPLVAEGQNISANSTLAKISGSSSGILKLERTLLNFLMRMCGVATVTHQYVEAVRGTNTRIVDTRKTIPGWRVLDKYAIRAGGGDNHRYDLGSGVLIKDNHILACGGIGEAVRRAKAHAPHPLRIEAEVESLAEAQEAIRAGAEILLLDNMTPSQVSEVVQTLGNQVLLEVSGGVTLQTVRSYAEAGAHLISVGALTHSTRGVDLSMELTVI